MKIVSVSENRKIEKRIAITPEITKKYLSNGFEVLLSKDYGEHLGFKDLELLWSINREKRRLNLNNVFDKIYLGELRTAIVAGDDDATGVLYNGIDTGNEGFFGLGRTWNLSLRYNF